MPAATYPEIAAAAPVRGDGALGALLHGAGFASLDDVAWIRVTGDDRGRWLNGMVSNSIQDLGSGEGCYNFVLSAQGRIQGDLTAYVVEDSILLQTGSEQVEKLKALLDRFIIMDDVELARVDAFRAGIEVAGPKAAACLIAAGAPEPPLDPMRLATFEWKGEALTSIHGYSPLVTRYEIWGSTIAIADFAQALAGAGAIPTPRDAWEHLRMLEGTPRYGVDIRDRELPQETNQTRALHFAKGCYLGQEIVERIRSRGAVHRIFSGFELTGTLPAPGSALEAEGKAVGEVTSVATVPGEGFETIMLALGYVRREALEHGLAITYPGGTARAMALPRRSL
jgi:folate-binding protein YgfZ